MIFLSNLKKFRKITKTIATLSVGVENSLPSKRVFSSGNAHSFIKVRGNITVLSTS